MKLIKCSMRDFVFSEDDNKPENNLFLTLAPLNEQG